MWEAGNGLVVCWRAKGKQRPHEDTKVESFPLCVGSTVRVAGSNGRGWLIYSWSGSYVSLASMHSIIWCWSPCRDSIHACRSKMNCHCGLGGGWMFCWRCIRERTRSCWWSRRWGGIVGGNNSDFNWTFAAEGYVRPSSEAICVLPFKKETGDPVITYSGQGSPRFRNGSGVCEVCKEVFLQMLWNKDRKVGIWFGWSQFVFVSGKQRTAAP